MMPRRTCKALFAALLTLVVMLLPSSGVHAQFPGDTSNATSVQRFMEQESRWPSLVGKRLRIEGRYTLFGTDRFKYHNCPVSFRLPEGITKPRSSSTVVEVVGTLERERNDFIFDVTWLRSRPTDAERVSTQQARLDRRQPQEWYNLADWTAERAKFYDDEELAKTATDLYQQGVTIAYEQRPQDDPDALFALADKVLKYGLDPRRQLELIHEGERIAWSQRPQGNGQQATALLERIDSSLPGSATPVESFPPELRQRYLAEPLAVYQVADDEQRKLLHRLLYAEFTRQMIEAEADPSGANGAEVAKQLRQAVPEYAALSKTYEQKEMQYKVANVGRMTRDEVNRMAQIFRERAQPKKAEKVIRDWLVAKEPAAVNDGPRGMMELAEEYVAMLNDTSAAERLYIAAYKQNPQLTPISQWLTTRGYVLEGDQWVHASQRAMDSNDPYASAVLAGEVKVGMTDSHVRAATGAAPRRIIRIASSGEVTEIWLYTDVGLAIQLVKRSGATESHVTRVTNVERR